MMRRNKGFTTAGLLTLALGIGATTAVFSVVYGVLLRPLPYPAADRLVRLSEEHPGAVSPLRAPMLSNLTYYAWSAAPRTIDQFAALPLVGVHRHAATANRRASKAPTSRRRCSPMLGETPALGRFLRDDDAKTGSAAVAVLSDRGWRERFNADPSIVGRGVDIDGRPATIVGVARPGFAFPDRDALMWMPLVIPPAGGRRGGRPARADVACCSRSRD